MKQNETYTIKTLSDKVEKLEKELYEVLPKRLAIYEIKVDTLLIIVCEKKDLKS